MARPSPPRLALLLALSLWAARSEASPADLFGFGVESQALAGTGASTLRGPTAVHTNPALLGVDPVRRLMLGIHAARFTLEADGAPLNDASRAILFGVSTPLPLPERPGEEDGDRIGLGLSLSNPGSTVARIRILNETTPQYPLLATRAESLSFGAGVGVRLPWDLSVGVGTLILASLHGTIHIDAGSEGVIENVTDDELRLSSAPQLGLVWRPAPSWSFAAVARSELDSQVDLLVTVDGLDPLTVPPLHAAGLAQVVPAQLTLETSHRSAGWVFIGALALKRWSAISRFREATLRCPVERADCDLAAPDPLGMSNTWVPRVALARELTLGRDARAELRVGYFHEPSPLPAQHGERRLFDAPRHAFTAGYGVALGSPEPAIEVGLAVQLHHLVERRHPTTPEPLTARGTIWSVGLGAEVGF